MTLINKKFNWSKRFATLIGTLCLHVWLGNKLIKFIISKQQPEIVEQHFFVFVKFVMWCNYSNLDMVKMKICAYYRNKLCVVPWLLFNVVCGFSTHYYHLVCIITFLLKWSSVCICTAFISDLLLRLPFLFCTYFFIFLFILFLIIS